MLERPSSRLLALIGAWLAASAGCKEPPARRREPPPPPASPAKDACERPLRAHDPANLAELPPRAGSFCLDPEGSDRGYGEGAKAGIDGICDLFDGECAIYQELGVKRVIEARYIDGAGSTATIDVKLSRFGSPEQALAMFSKRALGGADPAGADAPKPLPAAGLGALGVGNGYLWRGSELAEITYDDANASAEQIAKKADALLPPLAKEMGGKMAGSTELPAAAKLLPAASRLPLGLYYELPDALVKGAGPGALGYYQDGKKRWRVLAIAAASEAAAKAALTALTAKDSPAAKWGWVLDQKGAIVLGVGDEPLVLGKGVSAAERDERCLSAGDKRARLAAMIGAVGK